MKVTRTNMAEYLMVVLRSVGETESISEEDRGTLFRTVEIIKNLPPDIPLLAKTCSKCREMLPATPEYFDYLDKASDGLAYRCKKCRRRYMSNYGRQTRKRNNYPAGDLEAIQQFRDQAGVPREPYPEKRKPSKKELQMYAMESMAPGGTVE